MVALMLLFLSFYCVMVVYWSAQERAWQKEHIAGLIESQQQEEEQIKSLSPNDPEVMTLKKEQQWERQSQARMETYPFIRPLSFTLLVSAFLTLAALFAIWGWLRLRTFCQWLLSHPATPDSPSRAFQRAKITTSLTSEYAVARALNATRKVCARVIAFDAASNPASLHAVKHYRHRGSYFEEIRIEVDELSKGSVVSITVDGLRPTVRSDAVRNQTTLNRVMDEIMA